MTDKERKKIKLHFIKPQGLLWDFYIPVSFSHNGDRFVCYLGYGDEVNYLGYGETKKLAFEDLVKTARQGENLSKRLFEDFACAWDKIGKLYKKLG